MLVTMDPSSGPQSRGPSIMDSPTLARVERARIRLEVQAMNNNENHNLDQRIIDSKTNSSSMVGRIALDSSNGPVVKRGLLWQQRDRIFSRWKERYFVLTRDYLQCFKRASGSVNERISDMGQFIFKIKLVDIEKVEWLNRRSYSAISLFLGREGRVLLRTDTGLEDWFELLEECTLISKERRHALRITQGPRSRASLAALPCHSSFQTTNSSLGATYNFQLCDSVPDLSSGGGFNEYNKMNMLASSTSSAPRKIPIKNGAFHLTTNGINNNNFLMNGYNYGTPLRIQNHNKKSITTSTPIQTPTPTKTSTASTIDYDNDDNIVLLRRRNAHFNKNTSFENNANDKQNDRMYRRPNAPNDIRHSLLTDIDILACDSGLDQDQDTPPSTHRPSSYREPYYMMHSARDSTDTCVSSSRGTLNRTLVSPKGSFRTNHENGNALRQSVQENLQQYHNEKNRLITQYSSNKIAANDHYDPNQNKYHKLDGTSQSISSSTTNINLATVNNNQQSPLHSYHQYQQQHDRYSTGNGHLNGMNNNNCTSNVNMNSSSSAVLHPALLNIMNDTKAMKFRDRSFSDIQQKPRLIHQIPNNNSSSPRRRQFSPAQSRI